MVILFLTLIGALVFCGLCIRRVRKKETESWLKGYLAPQYYGYKGGFASLTKCVECKIIGLYEDAHPVNPCADCGGEVQEGIIGKWDSKEGIWELKKEGIWELKE
jgi:hypothetical protein